MMYTKRYITVQSSNLTIRIIRNLTYSRIQRMNVARAQVETVVMMTLYPVDGGLTKFGVTPGGGGTTPTVG